MSLRQHLCRHILSLTLTLPSGILPIAVCQITPVSGNPSGNQQASTQSRPPLSAELRGDLFVARRQYLDAIAAYEKAPQDSAVIANKIGVCYHHMFDTVDARKNYQRAIRLNSHYAEAINNLGAIYHSEKNYREAQRLYKRAIKLNPNSPLFYTNLGTSYFFEGNSRKGAEAYSKAYALDPQVFEQNNVARIEEASSTKDLASVNYVLAKTYAQAGRNDRALLYLRKAIAEGFSDRKRLMNDRELASLRDTPEFAQILSLQRAP